MLFTERKQAMIINVGVTFAGLLISLAFISYLSAGDGVGFEKATTIFATQVGRFALWFALVPAIYFLAIRFNFERRKTMVLTVLLHLPLSFIFAGIHSLIYSVFLWTAFSSYANSYSTFFELFKSVIFYGNYYLAVALYALTVVFVQSYAIFTKYWTERERSSTLRAELADAQLQALKMQIQPHFLFNTLHSISSLNLKDPNKANSMIARLGDFLRMTLDHSDEQAVSLSEELEFLRCYLDIEQVRFSDRLSVTYDIDESTLSAEVPHLILQPIVENAVKHGIAPHGSHGTIFIRSHRRGNALELEIEDNCQRSLTQSLNKRSHTIGLGLANVRSRLFHFYGDRFSLDMIEADGGMKVSVTFPMSLKEQTSNP